MPTRVTFLITDLHRGGSPLVLAAIAAGLAKRMEWSPEVVSIAPLGEIAAQIQAAGIPVTSLHAAHNRDLRVVRTFIKHVRNANPDLICSILIHANLVAAASRPFVTRDSTHPIWVQSIHTVQDRPRWHWYAQGIISQMADALIAPSHAVLEKIERYGVVPRGIVIPNGIRIARFREAAPIPPDARPWPADALVIGYVGRFDPVKRLDLLLRAARYLLEKDAVLRQRLHIALVGYGGQEMALRTLAGHLGLFDRIHFTGISREPERWYKCMNVLCLPSAAEGFGLIAAEALAAGIPVVACATPALRQLLAALGQTWGGVGWVGADPTPESLGDGLRNMLLDHRLPSIPEAALAGLSEEVMVDRYATALSNLLGLNP